MRQEDERQIMTDPRRRERIMVFLTLLEHKSSETYEAFCEILEERFPHLFLLLSDWDDDDVMIGDYGERICWDARGSKLMMKSCLAEGNDLKLQIVFKSFET